MSKDPAVLFYTSDFLTGTAFFTKTQRGEYITLLCEQHQLWAIPYDHMIEICGSEQSPVFKKFIKGDDGLYFNERMREESIRRSRFCESRRKSISERYVGHSSDLRTKIRTKVRMETETEDVTGIKKSKVFTPPAPKEVQEYAQSLKRTIDAERFCDFYEAKGWMIGKNKMKDWKAAARNWTKDQTPKKPARQDEYRITGLDHKGDPIVKRKVAALTVAVAKTMDATNI